MLTLGAALTCKIPILFLPISFRQARAVHGCCRRLRSQYLKSPSLRVGKVLRKPRVGLVLISSPGGHYRYIEAKRPANCALEAIAIRKKTIAQRT